MDLENNLRELRRLREQVERQLSGASQPIGRHLVALPAPPAEEGSPAEAFGRRLNGLRQEHGLTLEEVARATGISKAYLSQVENGRVDPPRDDKVRRLEELFGQRPQSLVELAHLAAAPEDVRRRLELLRSAFERAEETVGLLMERVHQPGAAGESCAPDVHSAGCDTSKAAGGGAGVGDEGPVASSTKETSSPGSAGGYKDSNGNSNGNGAGGGVAGDGPGAGGGNVSAAQPVRKAVPIINRVAAGYPMEFTDLGYPVGVADDYISMPPGLDDPTAFAVHVVGDSMEPRYGEGDIVIFSPRADIRSGDDCYVRFATGAAAGEGATFKRVYFDGPTTIRLQPLNDRYPPALVPSEQVDGMYRAICRYERL